jgi:hypothetical protein
MAGIVAEVRDNQRPGRGGLAAGRRGAAVGAERERPSRSGRHEHRDEERTPQEPGP